MRVTAAGLIELLSHQPPEAEIEISIGWQFAQDVCVETKTRDGVAVTFISAVAAPGVDEEVETRFSLAEAPEPLDVG